VFQTSQLSIKITQSTPSLRVRLRSVPIIPITTHLSDERFAFGMQILDLVMAELLLGYPEIGLTVYLREMR
jgi:hypothetical protein